jgi:hypothetical protein
MKKEDMTTLAGLQSNTQHVTLIMETVAYQEGQGAVNGASERGFADN